MLFASNSIEEQFDLGKIYHGKGSTYRVNTIKCLTNEKVQRHTLKVRKTTVSSLMNNLFIYEQRPISRIKMQLSAAIKKK